MPYAAINAQKIGTDWSNTNTYESAEDIEKLDINVMVAGVLIQWLEDEDRAYSTDPSQYVLLRVGFHSLPFATPIRRFRLKQWPEDPNFGKAVNEKVCEVDIREFK